MKKTLITTLIALASIASAETIFNRGNEAEPSSLDPILAQGTAEMDILRDIYVGLVDEDPGARLIPGVAEKWDISEDGKTYTFHLRDDQWSDGTPLTAHDFVYAWQRAVNPAEGSKYSFFLYPVKNAKAIAEGNAQPDTLGVTALDPKTLQVELENPTPYFLGMLVNAVTYPVPKHIIEKQGKTWSKHPIGNGAFKIDKWNPQSNVILVKSDTYWNKDNVALDKVIYHNAEDKNAELSRYRAGELDFTTSIPNDQIKWIENNLKNEYHVHNHLGTQYYGFNLTVEPFKSNAKLREALTLAIDRDILTQNVIGTGETPAYGYVVPGIANYTPYQPDYAKQSQKERIERAKAAYLEAGYSKDNPFKSEILYSTSDNNKKVAIAIAAMWKENLGVEVELVNKEWKAYLADRRAHNTKIFRASWLGDYDDANTFLEMFVTGGGSNTIGLADPAYDKLLADAAAETDMEKRAAILQQAEKHLIDGFNLIPINYFVSKHMIKPHVKGYEPNVMNHFQSKYIRIEK
ncbi:MAG: peptide ABC transporter substrate-binding protein [Cardiobacteriaceae bacterium]|nr:peptide ABC transporter substrate-binding protein [Cardiobacteriaceae bacterium]